MTAWEPSSSLSAADSAIIARLALAGEMEVIRPQPHPLTTVHPTQLTTAQTMGWREQAPDTYKRSRFIYLVVWSFL